MVRFAHFIPPYIVFRKEGVDVSISTLVSVDLVINVFSCIHLLLVFNVDLFIVSDE